MNFFKHSKYNLSSSKGGGGATKVSKSEHFHKFDSSAPKTEKAAKSKAPPAPPQASSAPAQAPAANQVIACFELCNKTSYVMKRFIGDSLFPEEIASKEAKMIRIGTDVAQPMVCYVIEKDGKRFEFQVNVANKMGHWFASTNWKEPQKVSEFRFKPDLIESEWQLPSPESDSFVLELVEA